MVEVVVIQSGRPRATSALLRFFALMFFLVSTKKQKGLFMRRDAVILR
jgi:hypothetical protein